MLKALLGSVVFIVMCAASVSFSQVELTDLNDPVYEFLKEMQLSGFSKDYNSSQLPISRRAVADYLNEINSGRMRLAEVQRKQLDKFLARFEYEVSGTLAKQDNLLTGKIRQGEDRHSQLYSYADSSLSFSAGLLFTSYYRNNSAVPDKFKSMIFGDAGLSARATLYDNFGFNIFFSDYYGFSSENNGRKFVPYFFPVLTNKDGFSDRYRNVSESANVGSILPKDTIFNPFQGYIRYSASDEWISLLAGRVSQSTGFGYIDKLFLSNNAAPYDKVALTLKYKAVEYAFSYGSIYGDSIGIYGESFPYPKYSRELTSKNIVNHYLGITFSNSFRLGLWESVVISEQPFSFTYLNPVSFLTSADLSSGDESTTKNNALMGIEAEFVAARGLSFQGGLLIDDLTFGTLFEDDSLNENKFGFQLGAMWNPLPGLTITGEYTYLDPFVYSHRSNKSTYTNRENSLGHALAPNSDEIALQVRFRPLWNLHTCLTYRHQRSGEGVELDNSGSLKANYGGYISYGLGDAYLRTNRFLDGDRINRDIASLNLSFEILRQVSLLSRMEYKRVNNIFEDKIYSDFLFDIGIEIDLR